jgi:Peptidase M50B-like
MAAPSSLDAALREVGALQSHLPGPLSAAVGAVSLVAAVVPALWQMTRHFETIAHEGAHAIVGSAMGRTVTGVRMNRSAEGRTRLDPGSGPGFVLAGVVGYLGSSGFGLAAAELIHLGHIVAVLWLTLLLLVLMLIPLRRSFGVVTVLAAMLLLYLVARYATLGLQVAAAYGLAWFLLLSGLRVVVEHGKNAGDAGVLRELTGMPRGCWSGFWLVGSVLALAFGGLLLL